jgi:RNA polymerase sigma-70 factor (ECF subfamily)
MMIGMSDTNMNNQTLSAEVFEAQRPRLVSVAYRMLGSLAEAEDVVQEAWLRWDRT